MFTPEQDAQIRAEYEAGTSAQKISEKRSCSRPTIIAAVKRAGGQPRTHLEANRENCRKLGLAKKGQRFPRTVHFFSATQDAEIASRYLAGESSPEIAASLGCSEMPVIKAIRRAGAVLRTQSEAVTLALAKHDARKAFSETELAEIAAEYTSGMSMVAIAKKRGVSPCTVETWIKRQGVPWRQRRRCTLNEAAFDNVEADPVAQYFVGLLMADGWIMKTRGGLSTYVGLGLSGDHGLKQVMDFRSFIGSSHKITESTGRGFSCKGQGGLPAYRLDVSSQRLAAALARFGIDEHKTKNAELRLLESSADAGADASAETDG